MTKKLEIYKCNICGNIVKVMHEGMGKLVCCNQEMKLFNENTQDAAKEKHVPVIQKTENGYTVKVGDINHPMNEKHYIEWIELITENKVYTKHLNPNNNPIAAFNTNSKKVSARAYCNLHGLWKNNK